jgi:tRNA (guanine37-N1)-methyltransferase
MWVGVISLFPEMFTALNYGITGRAIETGLLQIKLWNPREFSHNKHRRVDDRPYGGGPGMVLQVQPLQDAIRCAKKQQPTAKVLYLSPQGKKLDQSAVIELAQNSALILVNGRYEGVDERLILSEVEEEWSIGDYILSGGELAAMVLLDAVTRCLPGALGNSVSASEESFVENRLDFPHYTRPFKLQDLSVPEVLKSGDHKQIARWRLKQSLGRTWQRRPELLKNQNLTAEEQALLKEFIQENHNE